MIRNITIVAVSRIKSSIPPKKDIFSFIVAALLIISLFGSVVVFNVSAVDINEINTNLIASETNVSEIEPGAILTWQSKWNINTVDSEGNVGMFTSIALDSNDYPHISYHDISKNLNYAKWTGSEWSINTVDSPAYGHTSIALDSNDYPHISYHNHTNHDLKYAKWTGSEWSINTVDSEGSVEGDHSIALDSNDYPHISYHNHTNHDLKYAKWTGSGWSINTVDSEGDVGGGTSIALDSNGYPHISYYDDTDEDLKYAKWTGSEWNINTVDSAGDIEDISIALDSNDYPHISFCDSTNDYYNLKYAKWTGSGWNISRLDVGGRDNSIALDSNDYPHISSVECYCDDLVYAKWTGSGCVLTIISPTNGASTANDTIIVTGTAYGASGIASVTVNGALASGAADWSTWSAEVTLSEGANIITAVATDNAGNQNTTTITVYLESTSTLSIGSAITSPNSTVTIPVSVANVTNISGICFDLLYNSSVVTVSNVSANESFTGSSITPNIDNANGITNIVLTNSNYISASAETPVIDIAFNIIGGSGSSTSLDLQNVEFGDAGFNPYTPAVVVDGQITVGIKGDFNGNGRVDIGDAAKVAFMVAGKVPEDLNADFNRNGRVDVGDAAKIAFYLTGKVSEL